MKVVHLGASDSMGGADRSAANLHLGLLLNGINSTMLVEKSMGCVPSTQEAGGTSLTWRKNIEEILIWGNRMPISNTYYSLNLPGSMNLDHKLLRDTDVINLHWVAGSLSASSIAKLASFGKPIVWTLHDARPLTGGCHFPADCRNYEKTCTNCPQLKSDCGGLIEYGRSSLMQAVQTAQVHFVAPSSWMRDVATSSANARENDISLIPYGVDQKIFSPGKQSEARRSLGLDCEATYIILAAHSVDERRKGCLEAVAILKRLSQHEVLRDQIAVGKIRLLLCGKGSEGLTIPDWFSENIGYLAQDSMPLLYRSADILLFTSIQDNLPNVVLEAMACGLPVVAHDLPGIRDLFGEKHSTGIIIPVADPEQGADRLAFLINNKDFKKDLGCAASERIKNHFSLNLQAMEYIKLYRNLCDASRKENHNQSVTREEEFESLISCVLKTAEENVHLNKRILESASWKITSPMRILQKKVNQVLRKNYEEY
jgi:glycosyltransferase involved in cell wall biosynthesis